MSKNERGILLACMFLGYTIYYTVRKSCTYSMPVMLKDSALKLSSQHFGLLASTQVLFYTIGKLVFGFLSDVYSPKLIFSLCLFICGWTNIMFMLASNMHVFLVCWAINGFFQGGGWQPIVVLIKRWFSPNETGTIWSLLSASMNISSSLIPFLMTFISQLSSWRTSFLVIGVVACLFSILAYLLMLDSPTKTSNNSSPKQLLDVNSVKMLLQGRCLVLGCIAYLLWSVVKFSIEDWLQWFLLTEKPFTVYQANTHVMLFQVGGLTSCMLSGIVTDILMRKFERNTRASVVIFCAMLILVWLLSLYIATSNLAMVVTSFMLGFSCYGPHTLFGLMIMEQAPLGLAASAHALAAACSSVGAVLGGYPLVYLVNTIGWAYVLPLLALTSLTVALLTTITSQKTKQQ